MTHITVAFSAKRDDLISRLICWLTRWRHSHVVLISPNGTRMIESTAFPFPDPEDGELRDGVREVPVAYLDRRDGVEIRRIAHPDPQRVWRIAQKMANNRIKYDHEYLGAWLLRRGKGDANKLNCLEVITVAARRAGHEVLPDIEGLTPRDLYLISEEV